MKAVGRPPRLDTGERGVRALRGPLANESGRPTAKIGHGRAVGRPLGSESGMRTAGE